MVIHGHIRGGVIIADEPAMLPDGAAVRIEVLADMATPPSTSTSLNSSAIRRELPVGNFTPPRTLTRIVISSD